MHYSAHASRASDCRGGGLGAVVRPTTPTPRCPVRYDRAGSLGEEVNRSSRSASLSAEPLELLHIPPAREGVACLVYARRARVVIALYGLGYSM